jgi:putative acetyltransferase
VIREVFDEYEFTWEAGGYNADTEDVRSFYLDGGGAFWVMVVGGKIVGTGAIMPEGDGRCELCRLYLAKECRGKGWGKLFYDFIIVEATKAGYREMEIWSDVKLLEAHKLYERSGAKFIGQRICNDPDQSLENGYTYDL